MNSLLRLHDPQQAWTALNRLWPDIKAWTMAGNALELEVRPERRNTAQNALLHAMLTEVSRQVEWAGKKRDVEAWKRLLTAAWLRARGESVEILPAVDGHGVDVVFRRTSSLTKAECAELVDYVHAWAVERGVELSEPVEVSNG